MRGTRNAARLPRITRRFSRLGQSSRPFEPESSRAIYHLYVIRTDDRDKLIQDLKEDGISTGLHYPIPVHLQNCYRDWGYKNG